MFVSSIASVLEKNLSCWHRDASLPLVDIFVITDKCSVWTVLLRTVAIGGSSLSWVLYDAGRYTEWRMDISRLTDNNFQDANAFYLGILL